VKTHCRGWHKEGYTRQVLWVDGLPATTIEGTGGQYRIDGARGFWGGGDSLRSVKFTAESMYGTQARDRGQTLRDRAIRLTHRVLFAGMFLREGPNKLDAWLAAHPEAWQADPTRRGAVVAFNVLDYACDRNDVVGALARDAMRRLNLLPILIDYCDEHGTAALASVARTLQAL